MKYELRDYQKEASDAAYKFFTDTQKYNGLIVAPTGCHARGTGIIMADGNIRKVENIRVGDKLHGVSGDRTVLALRRGTDDLYRVKPIKGEPFVVNAGHVLHLYRTCAGHKYRSEESGYDEISINEYLGKSKYFKHIHKLHRTPATEFSSGKADFPLPPYLLGLLLGDGSFGGGRLKLGSVNITTMRHEVAEYLYQYAEENGYGIRDDWKGGTNKAHTYHLQCMKGKKRKKYEKSPLRIIIEDLGLWGHTAGDKFIPQEYKVATIKQRLELLAGLLDTDAHYTTDGNEYEYCTKSEQLAIDIQFLCRSLGFYCGKNKKDVNGNTYYRLIITGNLDSVPTKVAIRKAKERSQKKSVLVTGFSLEYIGKGEYYGFTLDGDHLYCDEQFFVHHNCGKSLIIADIANRLRENVLVFQPSKEILEQNYKKYRSYGMTDCSIYSASFNSKEISRITFAMIGSVKSHPELFKRFKYIIVDECHRVNPKEGMYKDFFSAIGETKILGLTATPYRLVSYQNYGSMLKFITRSNPRIFDRLIYFVQIRTLLERGYLAQLDYFDCPPKGWDSKRLTVNSTGADYTDKSVQAEYERVDIKEWLYQIAHRLVYNSKVPRKGILVFTRFIYEADYLVNRLMAEGVDAALVTGETKPKERNRILNAFKAGEIKVVANAAVLTCLSEDTEILTKSGWKGVTTISKDDLVAQYDNESITFEKPLRIIKKQHSGNFVKVEGRYMNIRITDDHNVIYRKRVRNGLGEFHKVKASELVGKNIFIPISGMSAPDNVEMEQPKMTCSKRRFVNYNSYNYRKKGIDAETAEKMALDLYERRCSQKYKAPNELSLDECTFIGFWLGDGTCSNGRYSVCQSLSTPKMCEWLESLMTRIGLHYTYKEYAGGESVINGRKCHVGGHRTYSLANGTGGDGQFVQTALFSLKPYLQKGGTDLYRGMSKEQILALCKGLIMADGYHGNMKDNIALRWISADKKLLDLLQAICCCRGIRMMISRSKDKRYKVPFFTASIDETLYHQLVRDKLEIDTNNDPQNVWCVTMPKGTIVTRRNGRVAILGNCGFDYPELDTIVMARPTRSLAMWYQIVGRAIRPSEGKRGWIVDLCKTYSMFGKVEDLWLRDTGRGKWIVESRGRQLTNKFY